MCELCGCVGVGLCLVCVPVIVWVCVLLLLLVWVSGSLAYSDGYLLLHHLVLLLFLLL